MEVIRAANIDLDQFIAFSTCAPLDFNLGTSEGVSNRLRLEEELSPIDVCWLRLVHGNTVLLNPTRFEDADAAVVTKTGHAIGFTTADCLPIFIASLGVRDISSGDGDAFSGDGDAIEEDGGISSGDGDALPPAIAGIHSGWRSLAGGVIENTCKLMFQDLHYAPADCHAWIGPAIAGEDYEVDSKVRDAFLAADAAHESHFIPTRPGHWLADLPGIAQAVLENEGIPRTNIQVFAGSTFKDSRLHSLRRDAAESGRMATVAGIHLRKD